MSSQFKIERSGQIIQIIQVCPGKFHQTLKAEEEGRVGGLGDRSQNEKNSTHA